jgi:hypothetical protein
MITMNSAHPGRPLRVPGKVVISSTAWSDEPKATLGSNRPRLGVGTAK